METDKPINSNCMVSFYHDIEQNIDNQADVSECRRMVTEFLRIEKEHGVPVTYNITGTLFENQPDLTEHIRQAGQEVAFHSYNHQSDWQSRYYSEEISLCRGVSTLPKGYRSPRSQWNRNTLNALWQNGFLWSAETDSHPEPYFIYKGLVRLPIAQDDWPLQTGQMSEKEWIEYFAQLLRTKRYVAFGSHDCVASFAPHERLQAWEKVLKLAIQNKSLLANFSEAADLFRRAATSKYYSDSAADWNQHTQVLYRTKRFRELIKSEAEKLDRPVVADLGSGGGVLTEQLKDIAEKIYCIDNAPGMVACANTKTRIKGLPGEATDSGLPRNSCDFVICARVIEYLFWPERLADEIRRIGKIGGTFFVTFPALRAKAPPNEGVPPDRIRHHFKPEEIQCWADRIGPGRLIGIQYDQAEPQGIDQEQAYRNLEQNPPPDIQPTNWVYIGTIREPLKNKSYRQSLSLNAFEFLLPKVHQQNRWQNIKSTFRFPLRVCRKLIKLFKLFSW